MEVFHVESDRTDLVVITLQEYRDLLTDSANSKNIAENRLHDWYEERQQNNVLQEKVSSLESELDLTRKKLSDAMLRIDEMNFHGVDCDPKTCDPRVIMPTTNTASPIGVNEVTLDA